jgi:hypothetical protein
MNTQAPAYWEKTRIRQEARDRLMDALAKAQRKADWADYETFDEGQPHEVTVETFAEVVWDSEEDPRYPGRLFHVATAYVIGARLGNILLDRDTLEAAFGKQVDALEERLSEEFTARGEGW